MSIEKNLQQSVNRKAWTSVCCDSCKDCCSPHLLYSKIARIAELYQSSIEGDDTSTVEWMCNYCGKPTTCSDNRLIDKLKGI